jgi:hypothetical protein
MEGSNHHTGREDRPSPSSSSIFWGYGIMIQQQENRPHQERLSSSCLSSFTSNTCMSQLSPRSISSSNTSLLSTPIQNIIKHKNQRIQKNKNKNAFLHSLSPLSNTTLPNINNHTPITISSDNMMQQYTPRIDTRRWSNLGGNILQRIRDPPQTPRW